MTYSVTDRSSFDDLSNWLKQIKMHASDNVVKILVANKCDSGLRKVTEEEGRKMAEEFGVPFF